MTEILIAEIKLFEDLLYFNFEDRKIDLHNDYDCFKINFLREERILKFYFRKTDKKENLSLRFTDVDIEKFELEYDRINSFMTIDNFYRGRLMINKELFDLSSDERGVIYLEFYEGHEFQFLSRSIIIEVLS